MYTLRHNAIKICLPIYLTKSEIKWQETTPSVGEAFKRSLPEGAKVVGGIIYDAGGKVIGMVKDGITSGADWVEKRKAAARGDIAFSAVDESETDLLATTIEAKALKGAILKVGIQKADGTKYSEAEVDALLADGLQFKRNPNEVDMISTVFMRLKADDLQKLRTEIRRANNAKLAGLVDTSSYMPPEDVDVRKSPSNYRFHKEVWFNVKGGGGEVWNFAKETLGISDLSESDADKERVLRELIVLRANYARDIITQVLSNPKLSDNGQYLNDAPDYLRSMRVSPSDLGDAIKDSRGVDLDKLKKEVQRQDRSTLQIMAITELVSTAGTPGKKSIDIGGTKITIPSRSEVERLEAIAVILQTIHDGFAVRDPTVVEALGSGFEKMYSKAQNIVGGTLGPVFGAIDFVTDNKYMVFLVTQGLFVASHAQVGFDQSPVFNGDKMGTIRKGLHATVGSPEWLGWKITRAFGHRNDVTKGLTPTQIEELKKSGDYLDPSSDEYKERVEAAKKEVRDLFKEIQTTSGNIPRTPEEIAEMERRIERIGRLDGEYRKAWVTNDLNNLPRRSAIDYYLLQEVEGEVGVRRIENITHIDDPDKRYAGAKRVNTSDPLTKVERLGPVRVAPAAGTATSTLGKGLQAIDPRRIKVGTPTEAILKQAGKAVFGQRTLDSATARMDLMTSGNTSEPYKIAATIKDGEGKHSIKPGHENEFEVKDASLRQQFSLARVAANEFAQYMKANQLHQQIAALQTEYQTIQYELEGKDATGRQIGNPIQQFQEEAITNSAGNTTGGTRKLESPAYKSKMAALDTARQAVSLKKQEIARLPVELQDAGQTKVKLDTAGNSIDDALKEIERIKSIKLDFVARDTAGNPKVIRTDMNFEPNAFMNKLLRRGAKFIREGVK